MKIADFEKELQEIDPGLSIRPNPPHKVFPQLEQLAAVTFNGTGLFTIPNFDIYDEVNPAYGMDGPDGRYIAHRTRPQALEMAKAKIEQLKNDPDYADAFFGRGEYSEANLRKPVEPAVELVEDIEIELKEVGGEENIPHENTVSK